MNLLERFQRLAEVAFSRGEYGSRLSQAFLHVHCERVRASEHAPRDPLPLLERRHGLAEVVECRAVVLVNFLRIIHLHRERDRIISSKNAPRHGYRLAQECLGFFEAVQTVKRPPRD